MKTILALLILCVSINSLAETIIVKAPSVEKEIEHYLGNKETYTQQDIQNSSATNIEEFFNTLPGIHMSTNGTSGQPSSVFIRGAEARHSLILINGLSINDPTSPTASADLSQISLQSIQKIEVVKGPQALLYGPHAIGGVINILTLGKQEKIILSSNDQDDYELSTLFNFKSENTSHQSLVGLTKNKGISSASPRTNESDGQEVLTLFHKMIYEYNQKTKFIFNSRYLNKSSESDLFKQDDPNYLNTHREINYQLSTIRKLSKTNEQSLTYTGKNIIREDINNIDIENNYSSATRYDGTEQKLNWSLTQKLSTVSHFSTITSYQKTQSEIQGSSTQSRKNYHNVAFAGSYNLNLERYSTRAGIVYNDNSVYEEHIDFKQSNFIKIKHNQNIRLNISSGHKPPSLFQLYSPNYGNTNLKVERSLGLDISYKIANFEIVLSRQDIKNLIEFASNYQNISKSRIEMLEIINKQELGQKLLLKSHYTYTRARNLTDGSKLLRRPNHKIYQEGAYKFSNFYSLHIGLTYNGPRYDYGQIKLGGHTLANVSHTYQFKKIKIGNSITNLFDKDYANVDGYSTRGRTYNLSLTYNF